MAVRDGVLLQYEPEHGGALAAGSRGAGRGLLRHRHPRQAPGPLPPRAQRLRLRHPLRRHLRRPPPQGPRPVRSYPLTAVFPRSCTVSAPVVGLLRIAILQLGRFILLFLVGLVTMGDFKHCRWVSGISMGFDGNRWQCLNLVQFSNVLYL